MIVDASAILSILFEEPDRRRYSDALMEYQGDAVMSPVNYLELALRLDRGGTPELSVAVDPLLEMLGVHLVAVEPEHAGLARDAYRQFGKGNHPAKLNLGVFNLTDEVYTTGSSSSQWRLAQPRSFELAFDFRY